MAQYFVMVDNLINVRAAGVSYQIHLVPVGYNGAVPVRHYMDDQALLDAFVRLGISEGERLRLLDSLQSKKDQIFAVEVNDEIAAEFGWPKK